MKRSGAVTIIFVLLLAAAAEAQANVTVRGQLLWSGGTAASGIAVALVKDGRSSATVYTDSRGFFAIYNVAPAPYTLRVTASGQTSMYAIQVTSPKTDLAPIRLRG